MFRVLLIEDDAVDQLAFKRAVNESSLPYVYTITNSVSSAKKILSEETFDIIVSDYSLCDGTAFDIFGSAKTSPIILITGHGDEEIAVMAMKKGASDYLVKDEDSNYLKILPTSIEKAITLKQIEEQNRMLQRAIMDTSDCIYIADMEDKITFVNNAFCKTYGYTESDVIGKDCNKLALQRVIDEKALTKTGAKNDKGTLDGEFIARRKNGGEFPAFSTESKVKDNKGSDVAIIRIVRDITERKRLEREKALRESSERYRKLIETANDAIFIVDVLSGKIVDVNRKCEELMGMPASRIIGKHHTKLHPEADKEYYNKLFRNHVQQGVGINGISENLFISRRNGENIPVEISSSVIDVGGNKIIQMIFRDVTERKGIEDELRAIKEQLQSIIDNTTAVIYLKDLKGQYMLINKQFEAQFHTSKNDIIGKTDYDIFPKETAKTFIANDKEVLLTKKFMEIEETAPQKDGAHTYISAKFPLFDSTGLLYATCSISTDITDRRKIEKEILEIEERERLRIGRDLHDSVGQILTGVAFKCDLLYKSLKDKDVSESGQAIEIETLVNDSINQVRKLAKGLSLLEDDPQSLEMAIQELASDVIKIYGTPCDFTCSRDFRIKDRAVATHLYRIVQEAVNNAVKHSKAKNIWINLSGNSDAFVVEVKDNGLGQPNTFKRNEGMGLRTMNYRANIIGASFKVRQNSEQGTVVSCYIGNQTN